MNNARMWLVVKPTVGIPLLFGGVAVASLAVHTAVLTNVPWFSEFLTGKPMTMGASLDTSTGTADVNSSLSGGGAPVATQAATLQDGVVVLPDGRELPIRFKSETAAAAQTPVLANAVVAH
ncbi:MAG: light-harvesting protein [Pseudomonadota bacterium]